VGGLVGLESSTTVTDAYWDTETTGQDSSDGGTGLTTTEMTGSDAQGNMAGFNFGNTWQVDTAGEPSYPYLLNNTQTSAPTP
jgi:hypothetical protein